MGQRIQRRRFKLSESQDAAIRQISSGGDEDGWVPNGDVYGAMNIKNAEVLALVRRGFIEHKTATAETFWRVTPAGREYLERSEAPADGE